MIRYNKIHETQFDKHWCREYIRSILIALSARGFNLSMFPYSCGKLHISTLNVYQPHSDISSENLTSASGGWLAERLASKFYCAFSAVTCKYNARDSAIGPPRSRYIKRTRLFRIYSQSIAGIKVCRQDRVWNRGRRNRSLEPAKRSRVVPAISTATLRSRSSLRSFIRRATPPRRFNVGKFVPFSYLSRELCGMVECSSGKWLKKIRARGRARRVLSRKNAHYSADVFACEATRARNAIGNTMEFRKRCTLLRGKF